MRCWIAALAAGLCPGLLLAQAPADSTPVIRAIEIRRHDVFDPAEATSFVPRMANRLHFTTRASVVRRELLFRPGQLYDSLEVAETARNLRSIGVFRNVAIDTIRSDSGLVVRVTTSDGWSTRPITNLNTTGSTLVPTVGLEELNLLGTATHLSVRYRIHPDRSTLTTAFRQPRLFAGRVGVGLQYSHLSDGDLFSGSVYKPFLSLSSRSAWQVFGAARKERILQFFEGEKDPRITLQRRFAYGYAAAAWALRGDPTGYLRLGFSGQLRREDYADQAAVDTMGRTTTGAIGPFLEWRAARFLVSTGLEGFAREEDVDVSTTVSLGVQATPRAFGYEDDGIVPYLTVRTGFGRPDGFVQLSASGIGRFTAAGLDSGSVHLSATAFLLPARRHLAVIHGAIGWQERPRPGAEFDLGLGLGPRIFKEHGFTGDRAFFTSAEYRWTAAENFLNLSAVGLAGFVDYGGAWYSGFPRRTGFDFGVGVRFGLTRATDITSSRLDVACRPGSDQRRFQCRLVLQRGFAFSSNGRLDQ